MALPPDERVTGANTTFQPQYFTAQPRILQNPEYSTAQNTTEPTILHNPEYYTTQNTAEPRIQRFLDNCITLTEHYPENSTEPQRINFSTVGGTNTAAEIKYKGLPFQSHREHLKADVPQNQRKMCHCIVTVEQGTRHGSRCFSVSKATTEPRMKYKGVPT